MKLQVQSIHFDADAKLVAYIQKKCDKLDTYYDRIVDGKVFLKIEKAGEPSLKSVEIKVNVPHENLMASAEGYSFEEAVDLATESLKRQVKKYKEKMRAH
ncbi:MAG TPA: ribosome-associated translation inhibitor RaiA [Bacteroidetes bacterium]|nr:ribosome-associated translation inhibitor RaiA [Bacteroidota bacterium]